MADVFYGNQFAKLTLSGALGTGRICHAYLITGDTGLGKRTFARLFAKALLCKDTLNGRKTRFFCGECDSCVKADTQNHPDIITLSGKPSKNSIHIDKIRDIRQDAYILPNESDYKIYIIENAENMTAGAANALLKVLEEPPAHAMFLLTAVSPAALYDTIVSRCIEIPLIPVSDADVRAALNSTSNQTVSPEEIDRAVQSCGGNIGTAKKMLQDGDYAVLYSAAEEIAEALISRKEYDLLHALQNCGKERARIKAVFELLLELLRRAIVQGPTASDPNDMATRLAGSIPRSALMQTAEVILEGCERIDKNVNTSLLLSYIAAKILS